MTATQPATKPLDPLEVARHTYQHAPAELEAALEAIRALLDMCVTEAKDLRQQRATLADSATPDDWRRLTERLIGAAVLQSEYRDAIAWLQRRLEMLALAARASAKRPKSATPKSAGARRRGRRSR